MGSTYDCSDVQFVAQGLSCSEFVPFGVIPPGNPELFELWWRGSNIAVDNAGGMLYLVSVSAGSLELRRYDSNGDSVQVNIAIMRTFVQLRRMLAGNKDLARKLAALERKYDENFQMVFKAIRELMIPPDKPKRKIGYSTDD